jgi:hypothetical protein
MLGETAPARRHARKRTLERTDVVDVLGANGQIAYCLFGVKTRRRLSCSESPHRLSDLVIISAGVLRTSACVSVRPTGY